MQVLECIEHIAERFSYLEQQGQLSFGHGTNNAFDEAAWLVLWSLHLPLDNLAAVTSLPISPKEYQSIQTLVNQRIEQRIPLAYLTKEAWLQGVAFYIDKRSIIPRSLIAELLVKGEIDSWFAKKHARVLDLCTGNGSLAILAAMRYPDIHIDAADISTKALEIATINIEKHDLTQRITLMESDGLTHCHGPYDVILCNPPYVNNQSMQTLPIEFQQEPKIALAGGKNGMDFITPLLQELPKALNPNGVLVLEIGHEYKNFKTHFPEIKPIWLATTMVKHGVVLIEHEALFAIKNR